MKVIAGYINIFIDFLFSFGIAVMASFTTFAQIYNKKSHNKKEAVKESIKDGAWFFIIAFICLLLVISLIQQML